MKFVAVADTSVYDECAELGVVEFDAKNAKEAEENAERVFFKRYPYCRDLKIYKLVKKVKSEKRVVGSR